MGIFSSEAILCSLCGNPTGVKSRVKLEDGYICGNCIDLCGGNLTPLKKPRTVLKVLDYEDYIMPRIANWKEMEATDFLKPYIQANTKNKMLRIPYNSIIPSFIHYFYFNELKKYEIVEDGRTVTEGGLGRALVGGLLFGGVGAVVGGVTGKRQTSNEILKLSLNITFDNEWVPEVSLDFISHKTSVYSSEYKEATKNIQEAAKFLDRICEQNSAEKSLTQTSSAADEILKYKQLLDIGAITQEEFQAKKESLLNL